MKSSTWRYVNNTQSEGQISRSDTIKTQYSAWQKRCLDVILVLMALPLILPILLIIAFLVRRDGGPAFFGHRRIGRDGKEFTCWKLRSMVPDADRVLAMHLAADPLARLEWSATQKLLHDPRITPLGRFIRRTSIDELPQLWNVLRGEMSLVGPRPVTEDELQRYGRHRATYLSCRPGLTGLWQVSGRNTVSYDERVRMDVAYALGIGLWLDLTIILRTFGEVIHRSGA
ncbi:sugar transferase [Halovulum sp. GXIMD14793]